jgi:PAS domain S-box-containing protein
VEIERMKKDGTIIPCMATASPLTDGKSKMTGIIEQFRDITAHRQMERKVRETEDRYKALIELGTEAGEAIVMLQDVDGKEGIQTFVNAQWSRITGYPEKELLGRSFFDLLCARDREESIGRHRAKMSQETVPGLYEISIIHKSGREVVVELTGGFTTYQDKAANIIYLRDITQRKLLEKELAQEKDRYKALFEHTPVATSETDVSELKKYIDELRSQGITNFKKYFEANDYNVLPCWKLYKPVINNQAVFDIYEIKNKKQYAKMFTDTLIPHSKHLETSKHFHTALAEGKTSFESEEYIKTATGKIKCVQIRYSIPPGFEDTWSRIFITELDITRLKEKEKRLINAEARLRLLSKKIIKAQEDERSNIARELHDQLGQELACIRLNALRLAENLAENPVYSKKALALAEMTLVTAKSVQRVSMNLRPQTQDILRPIEAIKEYIMELGKKVQIPFRIDFIDNNIQDVKLPKDYLDASFRVVQEALSNIIKHAQATRVVITFSIAHRKFIIKIEDNGKGMDIKKLNDKTSIGLLGMQERARIAGGNLHIISKPQKGTKIILTLPYDSKIG